MNTYLLSRAAGSVSHTAFARAYNDELIRTLSSAIDVDFRFNAQRQHVAHPSAVNHITVDKFEGRYLLSGGADASVAIWDLEQCSQSETGTVYTPLASVTKGKSVHTYGVTHVAYYPFDSLAFLSSSFDHTIRLWSSETLVPSASFDLGSIIYSFALSPIASHLLVACATQHQAVRLVDLRSGNTTHSLAGHGGAVLSVAWHPKNEHELASAATDGSVRLWDVRRSANSLGSLDMNDSTGSMGIDRSGPSNPSSVRARAHHGPANGLAWSESGDLLLSTGHDERIRVWGGRTGANTMANFGPAIKNSHMSTCIPTLAPASLTSPGKELLCFPNPHELLVSEVQTGKLVSRLRVAQHQVEEDQHGGLRSMTISKPSTTGLAWRAHSLELYSSHTDGTIRMWRPREDQAYRIPRDSDSDSDSDMDADRAASRKRKRQDLQDIVDSLTKRKTTNT